jgi:hypothetical protein
VYGYHNPPKINRINTSHQITPITKIKLLRGEHHRERVVLPEEEARYLAAAGDQMADIATVLIDTGCDRKRTPAFAGSQLAGSMATAEPYK